MATSTLRHRIEFDAPDRFPGVRFVQLLVIHLDGRIVPEQKPVAVIGRRAMDMNRWKEYRNAS
jgi:hypothetical protein